MTERHGYGEIVTDTTLADLVAAMVQQEHLQTSRLTAMEQLQVCQLAAHEHEHMLERDTQAQGHEAGMARQNYHQALGMKAVEARHAEDSHRRTYGDMTVHESASVAAEQAAGNAIAVGRAASSDRRKELKTAGTVTRKEAEQTHQHGLANFDRVLAANVDHPNVTSAYLGGGNAAVTSTAPAPIDDDLESQSEEGETCSFCGESSEDCDGACEDDFCEFCGQWIDECDNACLSHYVDGHYFAVLLTQLGEVMSESGNAETQAVAYQLTRLAHEIPLIPQAEARMKVQEVITTVLTRRPAYAIAFPDATRADRAVSDNELRDGLAPLVEIFRHST